MKSLTTRMGMIVTAAVLLVGSSISVAQMRPHRPGRHLDFGPSDHAPGPFMGRRGAGPRWADRDHEGPGLPILRVLRRLDLTDEQREEIRTILDDNADGMEAACVALHEAMAALNDATRDEADENTLQAAAMQVGVAAGERASTRVALVKRIKSVLSETQLATLAELQARREQGQTRPRPNRGMGPEGRASQSGDENGPHPRRSQRGRP